MSFGELTRSLQACFELRATQVARSTSGTTSNGLIALAVVMAAAGFVPWAVADSSGAGAARTPLPDLDVAAIIRIGNRGADFANAPGVLPDGTVALAVRFRGTLATGAAADLEALGGGDIAVLGLDRALRTRWTHRVGGVGHDESLAVAAVGPDAVVGGFFTGTAGIGDASADQQVTSQGGADGFLARFTAAGRPNGLQRIGGKGADLVRVLVAAPGDGLVVAGHFQQASRLAPGPSGVVIGAGGTDIFVQRLDASGAVLWARTFGGAGDDELAAAAALPEGGTVLLLRHNQRVEVQIGARKLAMSAEGDHDAFLLWIDDQGTTTRVVPVVSPGHDTLHLVGAAADGSIVIAGEFQARQQWSVGGSQTRALESLGSSDVVVLRLDATGSFQSIQQLGSEGPDTADALLVRGDETWLAIGWQGRLRMEGATLAETIDTSALLLHMNGAGHVRSRLEFEGKGVQKITGLAASPKSDVYATGVFEHQLSVRGLPTALKSAGKSDVFLARIDSRPSAAAQPASAAAKESPEMITAD